MDPQIFPLLPAAGEPLQPAVERCVVFGAEQRSLARAFARSLGLEAELVQAAVRIAAALLAGRGLADNTAAADSGVAVHIRRPAADIAGRSLGDNPAGLAGALVGLDPRQRFRRSSGDRQTAARLEARPRRRDRSVQIPNLEAIDLMPFRTYTGRPR